MSTSAVWAKPGGALEGNADKLVIDDPRTAALSNRASRARPRPTEYSMSTSYEVTVRSGTNLVKVVAQGFWTTEIAAAFAAKVQDVLRQPHMGSWRILFDFTEFVPQSVEVQTILRDVFRFSKAAGFERVAVAAASVVTLLQAKRLWSESGPGSCSFCSSVPAAQEALGGQHSG